MTDNLKKIVGINLKVIGFHNFPDAVKAFGEEIQFLEHRHRHTFGVEVQFEVTHNNRDIEFFVAQTKIKKYLHEKYGTPAEFGSQSCESIAEDLLIKFGASSVKVDEDGENYAIVQNR